MAAFSAVAKLTQSRYGTRSSALIVLMRENRNMVAVIAPQSTVISIKARPGERRPKKMSDQTTFRASWMEYRAKA